MEKIRHNPALLFLLMGLSVILLRLYARGYPLEMDEAEQLLLARELHWGYAAQPPLYSWLQWAVFKVCGYNLFSLALLKSTLLTTCYYCYYRICCLHCRNKHLAYCAALSWALIPAIAFDLLKDNTHSILALLCVCATWLWLLTPVSKKSFLWYTVLAVIIAAGLLAKFNYLLFLILVLLAYIPSQGQRWALAPTLLTGTIVVLLVSPYLYWLSTHVAQGLQSAYKLAPTAKPWWQGLLALYRTITFFMLPVITILWLFFRKPEAITTQQNRSLLSYHQWSLPLLTLVTLLGGVSHFATRWLIPVFFLCPVLYVSHLDQERDWRATARKFAVLCLSVQGVLLLALIYRAQYLRM